MIGWYSGVDLSGDLRFSLENDSRILIFFSFSWITFFGDQNKGLCCNSLTESMIRMGKKSEKWSDEICFYLFVFIRLSFSLFDIAKSIYA